MGNYTKVKKLWSDCSNFVSRLQKTMNTERLNDIEGFTKKLEEVKKVVPKTKIDPAAKSEILEKAQFILNTLEGIENGIKSRSNVSVLKKHARRIEKEYDKIEEFIDDAEQEEKVEPEPEVEKVKIPRGLSWKEQVQIVDDLMRGKKPKKSSDPYDEFYKGKDWGEKEYVIFEEEEEKSVRELRNAKPRLLKKNEFYGFIKSPIVIVSYYITDKGWNDLEDIGANFERLIGHYQTWTNATLMGCNIDLAEEIGPTSEAVVQVTDFINKKRSGIDMQPIGPVKSAGHHYYWIVLPKTVKHGNDIQINEWDFVGA